MIFWLPKNRRTWKKNSRFNRQKSAVLKTTCFSNVTYKRNVHAPRTQRLQMHGASNRDTHLCPPHNNY